MRRLPPLTAIEAFVQVGDLGSLQNAQVTLRQRKRFIAHDRAQQIRVRARALALHQQRQIQPFGGKLLLQQFADRRRHRRRVPAADVVLGRVGEVVGCQLGQMDAETALKNLPSLLEWTKNRTAAFRGASDISLLRNDGYYFLRMGGLIERADACLYSSKRNGRNQTTTDATPVLYVA